MPALVQVSRQLALEGVWERLCAASNFALNCTVPRQVISTQSRRLSQSSHALTAFTGGPGSSRSVLLLPSNTVRCRLAYDVLVNWDAEIVQAARRNSPLHQNFKSHLLPQRCCSSVIIITHCKCWFHSFIVDRQESSLLSSVSPFVPTQTTSCRRLSSLPTVFLTFV